MLPLLWLAVCILDPFCMRLSFSCQISESLYIWGNQFFSCPILRSFSLVLSFDSSLHPWYLYPHPEILHFYVATSVNFVTRVVPMIFKKFSHLKIIVTWIFSDVFTAPSKMCIVIQHAAYTCVYGSMGCLCFPVWIAYLAGFLDHGTSHAAAVPSL